MPRVAFISLPGGAEGRNARERVRASASAARALIDLASRRSSGSTTRVVANNPSPYVGIEMGTIAGTTWIDGGVGNPERIATGRDPDRPR